MTREEIVKALKCFSNGGVCPHPKCNALCPYWLEDEKFAFHNVEAEINNEYDLCRIAAEMLERDARGWISVKDKLPNDDATYLACGCDGYLLADYAGDGEWESFDLTNVTRYVSYWMPLPKEPEEEEK